MSTINDGGPAFPHHEDGLTGTSAGMTLRDYFAAKALHALLTVTETGGCTREDFAAESYRFADAMLAAREVKKEAP